MSPVGLLPQEAADTTGMADLVQRYVEDPTLLLPSATLVLFGVPIVFLLSRMVQRLSLIHI